MGPDKLSNEIYLQNEELFILAQEVREAATLFLKEFNSRKFKLIDLPSFKRIVLFFLTRAIKSYEAIYLLCREGYGQDCCPSLRSLLDSLISVKYILVDLESADKKAARFVEYKWVIFKRYLKEYENQENNSSNSQFFSKKQLILEKFNQFKEKHKITSDRALLTWSGKSVRDMAKFVDSGLLKEYESAFRLYSRFSHPSIVGDKEYINYKDNVLSLSSLPSSVGVFLNLKNAIKYLISYLSVFNQLFDLHFEDTLTKLEKRRNDLFKLEKYNKDHLSEESFMNINKEDTGKILFQFEILPEE